ncbi:mannan endo-1 [Cerrena zonata]|uniref:Mannan endo-1,6-alpha-mannosidase n=1 Tax=Cerrena zonata TaxID=2478898 RepID=A0AAW0G873_9APHY
MQLKSWLLILLLLQQVASVELDIDDEDSICEAAKQVVNGELNYYEGTKKGGTIGMFSNPYYWWHAGEAFGGLVDYYTYCDSDNKTLEKLIYDGMYNQAGDHFDYIPSNQSMTEGNDDQGVWGMAVLEAVEKNFTDPKDHSWLEMTQAIYNTMNARWDTKHCNGGIRWQIFTWNSGYNYKNSIANGCLFNIAARLARYTDNKTYAKMAEKIWNWMEDVGFATYVKDELVVYDGAKISNNCSDVTKSRWSYTYGIFLSGCAYMYNYTNDHTWLDRVNEIIKSSDYFFKDGYMYEHTCGGGSKCNNDQRSFRSLFARCLGLTSMLAPSTKDTIDQWLQKSAQGAAKSCSGGSDGVTCGTDWSKGSWDNNFGLGEQMSALEAMMSLLVKPPLTADTGGTSKSNVNAGTDTEDKKNKNELKVSSKDKAGAGVLTAIVLLSVSGGAIWMLF